MDARTNRYIIEMVKDITIAKMGNTTISPNKAGSQNVADFMQEIYDKLVELDSKAN